MGGDEVEWLCAGMNCVRRQGWTSKEGMRRVRVLDKSVFIALSVAECWLPAAHTDFLLCAVSCAATEEMLSRYSQAQKTAEIGCLASQQHASTLSRAERAGEEEHAPAWTRPSLLALSTSGAPVPRLDFLRSHRRVVRAPCAGRDAVETRRTTKKENASLRLILFMRCFTRQGNCTV